MNYVVGVDPGLSGAISLVSGKGALLDVQDLPVSARATKQAVVRNEIDPAAVARILIEWSRVYGWASGYVVAYIERVNAMPSIPGANGERRTLGASTGFSLGDSFGAVRGAVAARMIPIEFVHPRTWKAAYRLKADKELSRALAIRLYPEAPLARKKDEGRAESILIARYGAHHLEGVSLPGIPEPVPEGVAPF